MVERREDLGNAIGLNSALLPGADCCTGGALIFASKLSKLVELRGRLLRDWNPAGLTGREKQPPQVRKSIEVTWIPAF
jgi:hypothetical protein